MTRIEASRHIESPPAQVWEPLHDVARWPEWLDTVSSVQRLDDGPLRVGSRARLRQPRLPPAQWEVTEVTEGRSFTWEAKGPGLRTIGRHEVVPEGAGSRVTLGIEQTGPLAWLANLVWGRLTRSYVEREGRALAARVESLAG